MNHFPAHRPKPSRLAVNSPGRFQKPEPAPVNESSPTDSFQPAVIDTPLKQRLKLEVQRLFFITLDRVYRLVRFMGNVVRQRHR